MKSVEPSKPVPCAAILAGGKALRMGADKAEVCLGGIPLIEWVRCQVSAVARRLLVVGGPPRLDHRGVDTIPDRFADAGSLGGIATALHHAQEHNGPDAWVLCVACDMPFLDPRVLLRLWELRIGWDVVVPRIESGFEPLCALYSARCLPAVSDQIRAGNRRIRNLFPAVRTCAVPEEDLRNIDPELRSFINVNRPQDLGAAERQILGVA